VASAAGQRLQAAVETLHEGKLGRQPFVRAGTRGNVKRNNRKIAKIGLQVTPLGVDVRDADTMDHAIGRLPAVDGHSTVPLALSGMEVAAQSGGGKHLGTQILLGGLQLLDAGNVGRLGLEPLQETLLRGGTDAVNIERHYSQHGIRMKTGMDFRGEFVRFAVAKGVLLFGEFKTKAGRLSPYFFNAGLFNDGESLRQLGRFYAMTLQAAGVPFDVLFGPAYKGIPLVAATAAALAEDGRNVPFSFNRKEAKDHGEGGIVVGAPLKGRVMVVDDVISAGTSVRESADIIRTAGAELAGVVIALDRQERGQGALSAAQEVRALFDAPVLSICTLDDVLAYLEDEPGLTASLEAVRAYRQRYGIGMT
jgi:orotate phosphoribosyltransferase